MSTVPAVAEDFEDSDAQFESSLWENDCQANEEPLTRIPSSLHNDTPTVQKVRTCEAVFLPKFANLCDSLHNQSEKSNNILFGKDTNSLVVEGFCRPFGYAYVPKELLSLIKGFFQGSTLSFGSDDIADNRCLFLDLNEVSLTTNKPKNELISLNLKLTEVDFSKPYNIDISLIGFKTGLVDRRNDSDDIKFLNKSDFFNVIDRIQKKQVKTGKKISFKGSKVLTTRKFRNRGFCGEKGSKSNVYQTCSVGNRSPGCWPWFVRKGLRYRDVRVHRLNPETVVSCLKSVQPGHTLSTRIDMSNGRFYLKNLDNENDDVDDEDDDSFEVSLYENMQYIVVIDFKGCKRLDLTV